MIISPTELLLEVSVATSMAVLSIAILRKPLRRLVGAQAAYGLWSLGPASALAVLLPAPSSGIRTGFLADLGMNTSSIASIAGASHSIDYAELAFLVWIVGGLVMVALMAGRQYVFIRSLGHMACRPDGTQRTAALNGPMLIGLWRPRIVLPADFEARYSQEERQLVLAHEDAHQQRGDAWINAFATGWLCLFWFNPLMYWAIGRLRFDQELACDALVLSRFETERRRYATALLKTQLATDTSWRLPLGCHWQSNHPLKERITMLKQPLPGLVRRSCGVVLTLALTFLSGYAVWAAQPMQTGRTVMVPDEAIRKHTTHSSRQSLAQSGQDPSADAKKSAYLAPSSALVAQHPILLSAVDLEQWYPANARREGIEGDVQITVTLDEAGRATDTLVLSETPSGHGFAAAASAAAHSFQYRNPTGKRAAITFNIRFALN